MIVSKTVFAKGIVGKTTQAVGRWIEEGMPTCEGPHRVSIDVPPALDWLLQFKARVSSPGTSDGVSARDRASIATARLKELEFTIRTGDLAPVDELRALLAPLITSARTRVLRVPSQLATQLVIMDDPRQIQQLLDDALREALDEASNEHLDGALSRVGERSKRVMAPARKKKTKRVVRRKSKAKPRVQR